MRRDPSARNQSGRLSYEGQTTMRGGGDFPCPFRVLSCICDGRCLALDAQPMEFPEQPDRSEWRVIWLVFVLALFVSLDWDGQVPTGQGTFIVFAVIAGALMIWRQQARQPPFRPSGRR